MVLGKMQLSVLRTLKEKGTAKDGLHPTVSAMVKNGFVNEEGGLYSLSDEGLMALIAYDELTSVHREILMKVHKSSAQMQIYPYEFCVKQGQQGEADDLLAMGILEVDENDNLLMSDDGRILYGVLQHAYQADNGSTGGDGFAAANAKKRKEATPTPNAVAEVMKKVWEGQEKTARPLPKQEADCPNCGDCIHAEVLDIISARYPKVGELRDTLLKQKEILKELGL